MGGGCWRFWRGVVCAAIGVLWVRACSSSLFLLLPVFPWTGEAKGGGVGRVFSFFFLRKGGVVVVAGFRVGVRGKAAGRVARCGAKPGGCRLMGADGGPVPHFASVVEGEAFLAERDSHARGGFTTGVARESAPVVSSDAGSPASVGDGCAVAWDDARARVGSVSVPNGALVLGPSAAWGVPARLVRGLVGAEPLGNLWLVPVQGRAFGDDVDVRGVAVVESARDVAFAHVTGGALVGEARGVQVWERVRGRHGGGSETLFYWEYWGRRDV